MKKLAAWVFVKLVEPKIGVRFCKDGNSYDHVKEIVYLDLDDKQDCGFLRHLEKEHGFEDTRNYSLAVWSILHEIGHYNTLDECEEDDFMTRIMCAVIEKDVAKNSERIQNAYFNLESEWLATEWAIDYLIKNKMLCKIFSGLLR